MATNKTNNVNNDSNVTKVICQNCGAEIIIPNHEHAVAGIAIGKDSGLGTLVLPTVENNAKNCCCNNPVEQLTAIAGGNAEVLSMITDLVKKIEDGGYLDVDGIVRRWIPSQCLAMVYSKLGFHKALQYHGYEYSWKVLLEDLKKQVKLYTDGDVKSYEERNRWYNGRIAALMATDYIDSLMRYAQKLSKHKHQNRTYIKIHCRWMNDGKGIHCDEMAKFEYKLASARNKIELAKTPATVYKAVKNFNELRKGISFHPSMKDMSSAFINAYKVAGCYYTMKDLIMFEGCKMKVMPNGSTYDNGYSYKSSRKFVEKEESLKALEAKANEVVSDGVEMDGYSMLGLLKDFLEYNNFNFEATKDKWIEQSNIRKAFRNMKCGERRSRK